jgi:hypothetical protein
MHHIASTINRSLPGHLAKTVAKGRKASILIIFLTIMACPFASAEAIWEVDLSSNTGWGEGQFLRTDDRSIVRLQNDDSSKTIGQHYRVNRQGDRVRVSATMRVENLTPGNPPRDTAKLLVTLEGDGYKPLSYHPINLLQDQDWTEHEIEIELSPETKSIKLTLMLAKSTGILELASLRVENPIPTSSVPAHSLHKSRVAGLLGRAIHQQAVVEQIIPHRSCTSHWPMPGVSSGYHLAALNKASPRFLDGRPGSH